MSSFLTVDSIGWHPLKVIQSKGISPWINKRTITWISWSIVLWEWQIKLYSLSLTFVNLVTSVQHCNRRFYLVLCLHSLNNKHPFFHTRRKCSLHIVYPQRFFFIWGGEKNVFRNISFSRLFVGMMFFPNENNKNDTFVISIVKNILWEKDSTFHNHC